MIRRILKSGLLATVATLALLPTAAGAAPASAAASSRPLPGVAARQYAHHRTLPAVGRVVTHGARLNVRSGPGTGYRVIGHRYANRLVPLACKTYGSAVRGNHTWYRLTHHRGYVTAHYVRPNRVLPWC